MTVPNESLLVELDHFEDAQAQLLDVHAGGELIAAVSRLGDRTRVRGGAIGLALELAIDLVAELEAELEGRLVIRHCSAPEPAGRCASRTH